MFEALQCKTNCLKHFYVQGNLSHDLDLHVYIYTVRKRCKRKVLDRVLSDRVKAGYITVFDEILITMKEGINSIIIYTSFDRICKIKVQVYSEGQVFTVTFESSNMFVY